MTIGLVISVAIIALIFLIVGYFLGAIRNRNEWDNDEHIDK